MIYKTLLICAIHHNLVTVDVKCCTDVSSTPTSCRLFVQHISGLRCVTATLVIRNQSFHNSLNYSLYSIIVHGVRMVIRESISETATTIVFCFIFWCCWHFHYSDYVLLVISRSATIYCFML